MQKMDADFHEKLPEGWRAYLRETKETARVCKQVWSIITTPESKKWVRRMIMFMSLTVTFKISQPFVFGILINVASNRNERAALIAFAILVLLYYLKDATQFAHGYAREHIFGYHEAQLHHNVSKHIFEKSMGQHAQEGSILNIANIDKGRWKILELQSIALLSGVQLFLELALSFIFLFFMSFVAGCISLTTLALYLAWSLFLNYRTARVCTPIEQEFRRINRHRVERWELIERTKTSGKEEEELATLSAWQNATLAKDRAYWLWFLRQGALRGIPNTSALIGTTGFGLYSVFYGGWEIGTLVTILIWHTRIYENMWQIGHIEHQFNSTMPPMRSLMQAILLPPAIIPQTDAQEMRRNEQVAISFNHVSYAYPTQEHRSAEIVSRPFPTIRNICFSLEPGEKVALIGASGSGKTTIMRLLLRHMDPDSGSISINGTPLLEIHLASWLRLVGYIAQQPQIFDGTIRYNLTYGLSPDEQKLASDEELWEVMRLLQVDFGDRLLDGLDTRVGRHGMKLSGGQAQRLMIAAAVIKQPSFMVIDEATSSLDSITEKEVQHGLSIVFTKNVGALIVAHRLSTVRNLCNRFIVLRGLESMTSDEHQIEAIGSSFEELYAVSSTFRSLSDAQEVVIR